MASKFANKLLYGCVLFDERLFRIATHKNIALDALLHAIQAAKKFTNGEEASCSNITLLDSCNAFVQNEVANQFGSLVEEPEMILINHLIKIRTNDIPLNRYVSLINNNVPFQVGVGGFGPTMESAVVCFSSSLIEECKYGVANKKWNSDYSTSWRFITNANK